MRRPTFRLLAATAFAASGLAAAQEAHRPPSVPLIAHDPYFSVWSPTSDLNGSDTVHWTGKPQPLTSLIRVDGKTFTLMGKPEPNAPALPQKTLELHPTRSIYTFANNAVEVKLTFTSPLLPHDLDIFSRPATYITWEVRALDGKTHASALYLDASGLLVVNSPDQTIQRNQVGKALRIGSTSQKILGKRGDDLRIDWGHLYLSSPKSVPLPDAMAGVARHVFARSGQSEESTLADFRALVHPFGTKTWTTRGIPAEVRVIATYIPVGLIGPKPVRRHAIIAYDDEYSIQFFGQNLRPFWRRKGANATDLLKWAERDYPKLMARCQKFDAELMADLEKVGGKDYAYLGALAYRQSFAAQKVVADSNGQPLMFSKENFSNGCISTVDVLYPAAPQLLLFSPALTKASLVPLMEYAASPRWKWPFAPHDLGTYPQANGQVYGGGERTEENQMPVEESGNLLLILAALAKEEGNANFSAKYWPQLSKWAAYLADKGFDPESQLSTDDFAGHLAHNVNLSAKAIEALGAYAYLADLEGKKEESAKYRKLAETFAARWVQEAQDGDHTKLAFDKPGTWSQKYNLVWDRILGLNLFPASVAQQELAFYRNHLNAFGLPLDSREDYTKLDWTVWAATLSPSCDDFSALVAPIVKFLDATPDRVPMTDWYGTKEPRKVGFQARSVVGGVFIKMLDDGAMWRKYAMRGNTKVGGWAKLPVPPVVTEVVPTALTKASEWAYTFEKPLDGWFQPGFDVSGWKKGPSGFGTEGTPGGVIRTVWSTDNIWLRHEFELFAVPARLQLFIHHDEDAEVVINGVLAAHLSGYSTGYGPVMISKEAFATLKPGRNTIAIHCHQTGGGQYIDAGFAIVKPGK